MRCPTCWTWIMKIVFRKTPSKLCVKTHTAVCSYWTTSAKENCIIKLLLISIQFLGMCWFRHLSYTCRSKCCLFCWVKKNKSKKQKFAVETRSTIKRLSVVLMLLLKAFVPREFRHNRNCFKVSFWTKMSFWGLQNFCSRIFSRAHMTMATRHFKAISVYVSYFINRTFRRNKKSRLDLHVLA